MVVASPAGQSRGSFAFKVKWIRTSNYSANKCRCPANMARIRLVRPDYGLAFQVKVLEIFQVVPSSLGSGDAYETECIH